MHFGHVQPVGKLLREWQTRRRASRIDAMAPEPAVPGR